MGGKLGSLDEDCASTCVTADVMDLDPQRDKLGKGPKTGTEPSPSTIR